MSFDDKFIKGLLSGSLPCFEKFVKFTQTKAFRISYNILKDKEMVDEALQEGILKFYNAIRDKRVDKNKNIEAYFYSCIRNVSIDIYRKNKLYLEKTFTSLETNNENNDFDVGKGDNFLMNFQKFADTENLWIMLKKLPTKFREVLLMIEYEGMSPQEVAEITNSNINTVRWRLFRSKEIIRNMLKCQSPK